VEVDDLTPLNEELVNVKVFTSLASIIELPSPTNTSVKIEFRITRSWMFPSK